jgi:hypothetical protein
MFSAESMAEIPALEDLPAQACLQGCLKVDSGAVFRDLDTAQRQHSSDVVRQCAQTPSY